MEGSQSHADWWSSKQANLEIQVQDGLFDENDDNTDGSHKVYLDGSNLFWRSNFEVPYNENNKL